MNINSVQVQTTGCLPETHAQSSLCFQKDKKGGVSQPLPCPPSLSEAEPLLSTVQVSESQHKLHHGFFSKVEGFEAVEGVVLFTGHHPLYVVTSSENSLKRCGCHLGKRGGR